MRSLRSVAVAVLPAVSLLALLGAARGPGAMRQKTLRIHLTSKLGREARFDVICRDGARVSDVTPRYFRKPSFGWFDRRQVLSVPVDIEISGKGSVEILALDPDAPVIGQIEEIVGQPQKLLYVGGPRVFVLHPEVDALFDIEAEQSRVVPKPEKPAKP